MAPLPGIKGKRRGLLAARSRRCMGRSYHFPRARLALLVGAHFGMPQLAMVRCSLCSGVAAGLRWRAAAASQCRQPMADACCAWHAYTEGAVKYD